MENKKNNSISLLQLTSLVIGNMIGAGSYMMPASLAKFGVYAVFAWILTSCGSIILAQLFARVFILKPKDGGPYAYANDIFGKFTGFQMSWGYWLMCPIGSASLIVSIISSLSVFFPELMAHQNLALLIGIGFVVVFTIINLFGVENALFIQTIITFLKIIPLIIFAILAFFLFDSNSWFLNIKLEDISISDAILKSCSLTFWSFVGLESATIPAGIDKKIISKATILGVTITSVLYILSLVGTFLIVPENVLENSLSPFKDAMMIFSHSAILSNFILIAGIICFAGSLNGWILIHGQVALAASKHGLFPKIFQKVNKFGAPHVGIISGSIVIILMAIWQHSNSFISQFENIILLASFATLLPYTYFCASAFIIFKESDLIQKSERKMWTKISILGFIYSICIIIGSGESTIIYGSIMFFLISPLYILIFRQNTNNLNFKNDNK